MNRNIYNRQQRDYFIKIFDAEPHDFTDALLMMTSQKWQLDLEKLEKYCEKYDPEYNSLKCTYKENEPDSEEYSFSDYLTEKYGRGAKKVISDLILGNFEYKHYEPIKKQEHE